jgi:predicted ATPase
MGGYILNDADAPVVVDICRRLDGIPLAIELAAARAGVAGINALARSLTNPDRLLSQTQHAGAARHRTLHAAFDWSYSLLSETERIVLRRLSVFNGPFSLESACYVAAVGAIAESEVEDALLTLAEKSLVVAFPHPIAVAYRFLDTARAFGRNALIGSGELRELEARHATHFRDLFLLAGQDWERLPTAEWLDRYGWQIGNVRAALDWSSSSLGDPGLGVQLTASAVPLWIQLSLIDECLERVRLALGIARQSSAIDPRTKMQLHAALGWPQIAAVAGSAGSASAWQEALAIAEQTGDIDYQLRALWALWVDCKNRGAPREGLSLADRFCELAQQSNEPLDAMIGKRLRGASLHVLARHDEAREITAEMVRQYVAPRRRSHLIRFQFDQRAGAINTLARDAWLTGDTRRARYLIEGSLAETNHKLSRSFVLAEGACPIAFLIGDVELLGTYANLLAAETRLQALDVWHGYSQCFRGDLLIREGRTAEGVSVLSEAIDGLSRARFVFNHPMFNGALAVGLSKIGQSRQARELLEANIAHCEESGDVWYLSELYRLKGCIDLEQSGADPDTAEASLRTSLRIAEEQQAKAFAFRAATSLAGLLARRGEKREIEELLAPLYAEFAADPTTADVRAASDVLASL